MVTLTLPGDVLYDVHVQQRPDPRVSETPSFHVR